ncbi:hypothetical protein ARSEF1564_006677 [Beauveria bassiana]
MDSNTKSAEASAQLQPKTSNSSGAHGIAGLSQHRHDAATRRNSIHDQHAKQGIIGQTFHKLVGNRCREIWEIIYDRFNKFLANCVCGKVGGVSGKALFALLSRINHSCVPNTHWVFNTAIERLTVHAIRHIRAGEQITISYIQDPLAAKQNYAALENLTSWYACGRDVLQEAHGNDTKDASSSQVEQRFILWDKELKKESLSLCD